MGFFMHEEFVGLGGDSAIYRVYEQINRVVDMSEIPTWPRLPQPFISRVESW